MPVRCDLSPCFFLYSVVVRYGAGPQLPPVSDTLHRKAGEKKKNKENSDHLHLMFN